MRMRSVALLLAILALLAGCGAGQKGLEAGAVEVVVSAAASLQDALHEAGTAFEALPQDQEVKVKLRFNFGSSGALQQQIEQGAPVDLFISAARGPMDALVKKGIVEAQTVNRLAMNRVVLVRPEQHQVMVGSWADLAGPRVAKVAIGNPQHVPAGQYGKEVLEKLNLWSAVEPKLVLAEDVRQVLNYVKSGEVQAGILYNTDAALSTGVTVVGPAPEGSHAPVVYPMAVLKEARYRGPTQAFASFLLSERGKQILSKYGFEVGK